MTEIKLTRVPKAQSCKIMYLHIFGPQQKAGALTLIEQSRTKPKLGFCLQSILPS